MNANIKDSVFKRNMDSVILRVKSGKYEQIKTQSTRPKYIDL